MATKRISGMAIADTLTGDELVEISQLSASVTITATTISALEEDGSYNDSAAGFVAAGFAIGDRVKVIGFTGDVANNIFSAAITDLTTSKMTIGGDDGLVIVDDAAGESVTITKWTTKRATAQEIGDLGGGGGASLAVVTTVSGADTDLLNSHAGAYLRFTNASAKTLTVQDDATEPLDDNVEFHIRNVGTADLTLVEDTAVTINPPNGGTLVIPSGGTATLKRVAEDEFDLFGQVIAA